MILTLKVGKKSLQQMCEMEDLIRILDAAAPLGLLREVKP